MKKAYISFWLVSFAASLFLPNNVNADALSSKLSQVISGTTLMQDEIYPTEVKTDPKTYLQNFQGKHDVSLFTGVLNYTYPVWIPKGRLGMEPDVTLTYSSIDQHYNSPVGFGWSLPTNAVYRTPKKGADNTYNSNQFSADLFGKTEELIVVDESESIYAPKIEGDFIQFTFSNDSWTAKDKKGITYTFGTQTSTRQDDPADSTRIYKWMLEKIQDPNGNFITFTYTKDNGAIYPDTIRYTGWDTNNGIFEIKFNLESRDSYWNYRTGFKVSYEKLIDSIELITYESGSPVTFLTYDLDYTKRNNAIWLLDNITVSANSQSLPPTQFEYYDGTETGANLKINGLKKITDPYGGTHAFEYKPSTTYRNDDTTSSNMLPFIIHTVSQVTEQASTNDPVSTTTYDYRDGHYYVDEMDAFRREYAGFGKVTVTDPAGNIRKIFFHQSQNDPNNTDNATIGEYQDDISKKGQIYRDERWDNAENIRSVTINKWDKSTLADEDTEEDRIFPFLARTTTVEYGENDQSKSTAKEYDYDDYGNTSQVIDYGEVTLTDNTGAFTDTGTDKLTIDTTYAYNTTSHLLNFVSQVEKHDNSNNLIGRQKNYYDSLQHGQVSIGNLTKTETYKDANNYITSQTSYTDQGLPETMTNPRDYDTTITYDEFNLYPETITNAKNQDTSYTYDPQFGTITSITDPNGGEIQKIYDGFGRLTEEKVKAPDSQLHTVKTISYDLSNYPAVINTTAYTGTNDNQSNPIEVSGKAFLDGFGRPIQSKTEAEGATNYVVTSTTYDELGNVKDAYLPKSTTSFSYEAINTSDPKAAYTYDPLNRVKTVTNDLGTTTTVYNDWSSTVTDPNSKTKDFIYDARGNLKTVTEYLSSTGHQTSYGYDANNNLTSITDTEGNEKELTYDFLGRKLSETLFHDPDNQSPNSYSYTYDDNSNISSRTDAKDQTINYTYDELDRISTENTNEVTYTYDQGTNGIGHLTSVSYSGGGKTYTYDIQGRLTDESITIDSTQYTTGYDYDLLGNYTGITYPNSGTVAYVYNNAGQLESVTNYVTDLDYSPAGAVSTITYANGVTTTNTYDPDQLYRLTHKVTNNGTADLQDITYTYDPVGNITDLVDASATNAAKTAEYGYDDLYRLTSATITITANNQDYTQTYSYSTNGNITSKSDLGTYTYTGVHPHAVTGIGSTTYSYDDNGSRTGDGTWTHTYDTRNRLISSADGSATINYSYDAGTTRTLKTDGTNTVAYVNKYYEIEDDGNSDTPRQFIYAGDMKIAKVEGATVTFDHPDHLSGSNVATDSNGAQVELTDYYPYGSSRIEERGTGYNNDYLYTGKERDEETGQYYYGARYYDAEIGRFTSQDPCFGNLANPQSLNKYSYVTNRPLIAVDPTGESLLFLGVDSTFKRIDLNRDIVYENGDQNTANNSEVHYGAYFPNGLPEVPEDQKIPLIVLGSLAGGGNIVSNEVVQNIVNTASGVQKTYQVYTKANESTGEVYTGRTSGTKTPEQNVQTRDYNHHKNAEGYDPAQLQYSTNDYNAVRGQEQRLIEYYRAQGISGNSINGISPSNQNLNQYIDAAKKLFGKYIIPK